MWKDFKKESRKDWGTETEETLHTDKIQLGAILRIADALEKIAVPYSRLAQDAERYEGYYRDGIKRERKLERRIAGLRGYIKSKKH